MMHFHIKKRTRKIAGLLLMSALTVIVAVSVAAAQTATTTTTATNAGVQPLTVSCNGVFEVNSIMWNLGVQGGFPPITILWSGDPGVSGSNQFSVIQMNPSVGTHTATVQVTDATGATQTATCSAVAFTTGTIASSTNPSVPAGGPPPIFAPTSTPVTPPQTPTTTPNPNPVANPGQVGLTINNSVNNANPSEGANVTYTITVSSFGSDSARGVTVTDLLPSGLTLVSATPSSGNFANGVWTLGDMPSNSTAILSIIARVNSGTAGTTIANTATVQASNAAINIGQNSSTAVITVAFSPIPVPPPPTPGFFAQSLSIDQAGNFSGVGMRVTSVDSNSFQATLWGITYTVEWSGGLPQVFMSNGAAAAMNTIPSQVLSVGDTVNVSGAVSVNAPFTVGARVIRDEVGSIMTNPGGTIATSTVVTTTDNSESSVQVQLNALTTQITNIQTLLMNIVNRGGNHR